MQTLLPSQKRNTHPDLESQWELGYTPRVFRPPRLYCRGAAAYAYPSSTRPTSNGMRPTTKTGGAEGGTSAFSTIIRPAPTLADMRPPSLRPSCRCLDAVLS